ncbi:YfhO family protein [Listeria ilorinensis]|uniref:YfhO family protein n=1 Tax=Listeria ilorinensis TaxID=2867439 RepID=UPI001EF66049|nr:YfhO family protein [Listeria ilorinensis]
MIKNAWRNFRVDGLVLFLFVVISIFMFYPYYQTGEVYTGDDFRFHIQRMEGWYQMLSSGGGYSYANFLTFRQIGYPLDLFYPFLTFFPSVFFRFLFTSPITAYYAYFFVWQILTMGLCYFIGRKLWRSRLACFSFAVGYSFATYRLIDLFYRAAVGETLALTFFPLAIYGLYALAVGKRHAWIPLSLGVTFVLFSHLLSVVLLCAVLFLMLICYLPEFLRHKKRWFALGGAFFATVLFAAITLFPLLEQMQMGDYTASYRPTLSEYQLSLGENLWASLTNQLQFDWLGTDYCVGFFAVLSMVFGVIFVRRITKFGRVMLFLAVFFFLFECLMNWDLVQDTAVATIQFPWRLDGVITVCALFVLGEVLEFIWRTERFTTFTRTSCYIAALLIVLLSLVTSTQMLHNLQDRESSEGADRKPVTFYNYEAIAVLHGGWPGDYLSEAASENQDSILAHETFLENGTFEEKVVNNTLTISCQLDEAGVLDTYVPYYKGFKIYDNGKELPVSVSDRGTIQAELSDGSHHIVIGYEMTAIQKISWTISLLSGGALLTFSLWQALYAYRKAKRSKQIFQVDESFGL